MFSLHIVDSDAFLDMPISSQLLYFHLCMRADDEGFVGNPKRVMRTIGASDDDYKILIAKRFIITFENSVMVIKHWLIHNTIRMDRFNPTTYQDEKNLLSVKENSAYTLGETTLATKWQPNGNQLVPQVKLSKVKLSKESSDGFTKKKVEKTTFGEFANVHLSADEHAKLVERYGKSAINQLIGELSTYTKSSGKSYKDHYATLLNWAQRKGVVDVEKPKQVVEEVELTEEQRQANLARIASIRENLTGGMRFRNS